MKKVHPPKCSHPSCEGKIFSNPGNLRAHLKLHEQRRAEDELQNEDETDSEIPLTKKRRGGEFGREWKCQMNGCDKDYKSVNYFFPFFQFNHFDLVCYPQKKALQIHINVGHQGRRDFSCNHGDCTRTFGYKHLLQRHVAKIHSVLSEEPDSNEEEIPHQDEDNFNIELITGNAYAKQAEANLKTRAVLRCPYPELDGLLDPTEVEAQSSMADSNPGPLCLYVFSRGYDLRRHLGAIHNVVLSKEVVDRWVKREKQCQDIL